MSPHWLVWQWRGFTRSFYNCEFFGMLNDSIRELVASCFYHLLNQIASSHLCVSWWLIGVKMIYISWPIYFLYKLNHSIHLPPLDLVVWVALYHLVIRLILTPEVNDMIIKSSHLDFRFFSCANLWPNLK